MLSSTRFREQITKTTNTAERYNQFCEWIRFASGGLMAENDPEEIQTCVRNTDIAANALLLQNVADLTHALEQLRQQGYPVQSEDVTHLSAYMTEHLQRFREYTLKLRPVAPLSDQEKTPSLICTRSRARIRRRCQRNTEKTSFTVFACLPYILFCTYLGAESTSK